MKLYLATPHTYCAPSNFEMNLYLASPRTGHLKEHLRSLNLSLALANSGATYPRDAGSLQKRLYILESFYYVQDWMLPYIREKWNFLLDSGAFTFMQETKKGLDWEKYVERYAQFIVENGIEVFFELDIDSVVGLSLVERLREKLERLTNRKCIPVWHKSRGMQYWLDMATNYDYIAIGGIVSKEITKDQYKFFPQMIEMARERGARVHGLGFTSLPGLKKYKFDSVDSTAWTYGNRAAFLQKFDGETIIKLNAPPGRRMKSKEVAIHNFNEWVKFQQYAENHL